VTVLHNVSGALNPGSLVAIMVSEPHEPDRPLLFAQ
jgi:hypothetical protein